MGTGYFPHISTQAERSKEEQLAQEGHSLFVLQAKRARTRASFLCFAAAQFLCCLVL